MNTFEATSIRIGRIAVEERLIGNSSLTRVQTDL